MLIRLRLLKEKSKKHCRQSIVFIPHCLTYGNVICGFMSITQALAHRYDLAAFCIILASICDFLDGRVARKFGCSSYFGMELDSLADAISFCLAPVILIYCWQGNLVNIVSLIALMVYLCAGLARLARFNVTSSQEFFIGLPTTCAALFVALSVMCCPTYPRPLLFILSVVVPAVLGLLMVCSIKIPSGKNSRSSRF